jgi:NADPH-dependent ferric siderophore reductase
MRHEARRRHLTVADARPLTPRMRRVRLVGEDLADFASGAFDDHIRVFFPAATPEDPAAVAPRDFTPRRYDQAERALTVDVALHAQGPASAWAERAKPGDPLVIGGPRGSQVPPDDFDWWWMIGDETALPAMGRRLEEARPGERIVTLGLIGSMDEVQSFETQANWRALWIVRSHGPDDQLVRRALDGIDRPGGDGFVWIAGEASFARSLRAYLIETREHPKAWMKAAGYWKPGDVAAHERIED